MPPPELYTTAALYRALESLAHRFPAAAAIATPLGIATYTEVLAQAQSLETHLQPYVGRRIGIAVPPSLGWMAAMAACDKLDIAVTLLSPQLPADALAASARTTGLAAVMTAAGQLDDTGVEGRWAHPGGSVTLLTSGTTGAPKHVMHTWSSLFRPARLHPRYLHGRWLLAYPLHLYAGLQVFSQCLHNAGTLYPHPEGDPVAASRCIAEHRIDFVSATPSFWRRLLMFGSIEALRSARPQHLTLGGEPVTDELLQRLRDVFPHARITHIYATSELGRCFAVSDGRAGFPAHYLEHSPEKGVEMRVVNGELQLKSSNGASSVACRGGDWFATGDLVEITGNRVIFRGRSTELIHVGGHKIHPSEVETVLREVAGVAEAHVYPIDSALVGSLLGARITPRPGIDARALERSVRAHCARRLSPYQRPRIVDVVDCLELSDAHKLRRHIAA